MKVLNYIAGIGALVSASALDSPGFLMLYIFLACMAWFAFYYFVIYKEEQE